MGQHPRYSLEEAGTGISTRPDLLAVSWRGDDGEGVRRVPANQPAQRIRAIRVEPEAVPAQQRLRTSVPPPCRPLQPTAAGVGRFGAWRSTRQPAGLAKDGPGPLASWPPHVACACACACACCIVCPLRVDRTVPRSSPSSTKIQHPSAGGPTDGTRGSSSTGSLTA